MEHKHAIALMLGAVMMTGSLGTGLVAQSATVDSPIGVPGWGLPAMPGPIQSRLGTVEAYTRMAQGLTGKSPSEVFGATAGGLVPVLSPSGSLAEALDRLAMQAGQSPQASDFSALSPPQQEALRILVDGVRQSAVLMEEAFADLAEGDKAFLLAHILEAGAPGSATQEQQDMDARIQSLVPLVKSEPIASAGKVALQALEQARLLLVDARGDPLDPNVVIPAYCYAALDPVLGTCPHAPTSCVATGVSFVDSTGMVEVGFRGQNHYTRERVLIVDLGGDDCYENYPATATPVSGLLLPVSLILDLDGDDIYRTFQSHPAPYVSTRVAWGGGVGIGGVGALVDASGEDLYEVIVVHEPCLPGSNVWTRVWAQGAGYFGAGALVDLAGNDEYMVEIRDAGKWCNAGSMTDSAWIDAQGKGESTGVGLLLDAGGDDWYDMRAMLDAHHYGNILLAGQGAASPGAVGTLLDASGDDDYYATALVSNSHVKHYLGSSMVAVQGASYATPYGPQIIAASPCPCPQAGQGLLVDLGGADAYGAHSFVIVTTQSNATCRPGDAVAVGQGGVLDTRLAAVGGLIDLASTGTDDFVLNAQVIAPDCLAGVRARAVGQGGALIDKGPSFMQPPPQHDAFLVRASLCKDTPCNTAFHCQTILTSLTVNCPSPDVAGASYVAYSSVAHASNTTLEEAITVAQGAVMDRHAAMASTAGIRVDPMGPDESWAYAFATGRGLKDAKIVVQGAVQGIGIAAAVDLGGSDSYYAASPMGGFTNVLAQGQTAGTSPVAAFLDAGGADTYSEPCPSNAAPMSYFAWGHVPGPACGSAAGTLLALDLEL